MRVIILLLCLAWSIALGQDSTQSDTTNTIKAPQVISIALFNLDAKGIDQNLSDLISEALMAELNKSPKFKVMERSKMDEILNEQGFQESGACDSESCQVQMGQLLGIDQMIVGSIGEFQGTYILNLRRLDITTSAILTSTSESIEGNISRVLKELVPQSIQQVTEQQPKSTIKSRKNKTKLRSERQYSQSPATGWSDCGIGGSMFPDNNALGVTVNLFTTYGLPAASSPSTSPSSCNKEYVSTVQIIHIAYQEIEQEILTGELAYTTQVLNQLNCTSSSHPVLFKKLRSLYIQSKPTPDASINHRKRHLWNQFYRLSQQSEFCETPITPY